MARKSFDSEARAYAEERAGERIAQDSNKMFELVSDNLDDPESPLASDDSSAELLILLRDLYHPLHCLCSGDTLDQAFKRVGGLDDWLKFMRLVDRVDAWTGGLIDEAASDAVDEAETIAAEDHAESRLDDLDYL